MPIRRKRGKCIQEWEKVGQVYGDGMNSGATPKDATISTASS